MSCQVAQRTTLRRVANALDDCATVVATSLCAPEVDPENAWTLEVTLDNRGAPAPVLRELAVADCRVLHVTPRTPAHTTLVARA